MLPAGSYSETTRKLVHIAFGGGALLLPYLWWWQAVLLTAIAVLFNIYLLRWFTGGRVHRPVELRDAYPSGIVLYPASVLALLLLFRNRPDIVAAAWGILAVGDGTATLAGRYAGGPTWPWNRHKTLAGSAALLVCGGAAGSGLAWWCRGAAQPSPEMWFLLLAPPAAALAAAAAESAPIRLNDNVTVPAAAGAMLWALSLVAPERVVASVAAVAGALPMAVVASGGLAALGYLCRVVTASGALAGAVIGTIVYVAAGPPGWLLLLGTFAAAAGATRVGARRKARLRIAEERGGRRGAGNALANTGIAAACAVLSVVTEGTGAFLIAFAAALVAGSSDTIASEIGKASRARTWSVPSFTAVPAGTPGGVSFPGTTAGLTSAALMAVLAWMAGLVPGPAIGAIVAGAFAGSAVESVLGATLEPPGIVDNHTLNLINTTVAAAVAVWIAGR